MKTITALLFLTAASMQAATIQSPVFLKDVNGTLINNTDYTSPYTLTVGADANLQGGTDIQVWCIDPTQGTALDSPYIATVYTGDVGVPGFSQQTIDTIDGIIALSLQNGDVSNPNYSAAIWNLVDPSQWPDSAAIESIMSKVAGVTVYPDMFQIFLAPNEQAFDSRVLTTATPEPASWIMGIGLVVVGWRRARRRA